MEKASLPRTRLRYLLLISGVSSLIAGCGQPVSSPQPPSPGTPSGTGTILGYVVNANAGEAVVGSTVKVYRSGTGTLLGTTTTGPDGSFTFDASSFNVNAVDLEFAKSGYAGSKVINLRLNSSGPTLINVIQRRVSNPAWPTTPPNVVLGGVKDGEVYEAATGYIPYNVTVTPQAPLSTDLIYVALGKTPGSRFITGRHEVFFQTNATGERFLDPLDYAASGPTTFQVVVYDSNGNRTHLFRYIEVSVPFYSHFDLVAPEARGALAVTLNKQIEFFSLSPQAAPAGANLFTQIVWQPRTALAPSALAPSALAPYGYHIYRSFDGQSFTRVGTVPGDENFFIDASPELAPGRTAYYRVTAFIGGRESSPSNVVSATPLKPFDVRLQAPGDGAVGVPARPEFRWQLTQTVSNYHYYAGAVWDTLTGRYTWFTGAARPILVNRTSWTWNEDGSYTNTPLETLQRGRTYEWRLVEAYALDDPVHPTAVSIAADGLGLWFPFGVASTDHFTFTTEP